MKKFIIICSSWVVLTVLLLLLSNLYSKDNSEGGMVFLSFIALIAALIAPEIVGKRGWGD